MLELFRELSMDTYCIYTIGGALTKFQHEYLCEKVSKLLNLFSSAEITTYTPSIEIEIQTVSYVKSIEQYCSEYNLTYLCYSSNVDGNGTKQYSYWSPNKSCFQVLDWEGKPYVPESIIKDIIKALNFLQIHRKDMPLYINHPPKGMNKKVFKNALEIALKNKNPWNQFQNIIKNHINKIPPVPPIKILENYE